MLSVLQVQSALSLGVVASLVAVILLGRAKLSASLVLVVVGAFAAVKLYTDTNSLQMNYYKVMEVGRQSSSLDIRRSYKVLSKKYHPDKSTESNAEEVFQQFKVAYDVLMDEEKREIYNRFGADHLKFDPRKDELKMLTDVGTGYLFWAIFAYFVTAAKSTRSSRSWITILGIIMLIVELCFCISEEITVPSQIAPSTLTEYESIYYMHSLFPVVVVMLATLSRALYVDVDETSVQVLNGVIEHQKSVNDMLSHLEDMLDTAGKAVNTHESKEGIHKLKSHMEDLTSDFNVKLDSLKKSTSSLGSDYHWLVLVLVYVGIFYFQS